MLQLSKNLEISYMNNFIGKEVVFIPEVIKDGYLYGHTGNYLYVKALGCKEILHQDVKVIINKVNYPFVEADIIG